jgi:hypothetical protein
MSARPSFQEQEFENQRTKMAEELQEKKRKMQEELKVRRCRLKSVQPVFNVPGFSSCNSKTRRLLPSFALNLYLHCLIKVWQCRLTLG